MDKNARIFIAGHRGLVGSALCRQLEAQGYINIITRSHEQLDLTSRAHVRDFFKYSSPEYVFLAAARVGGIMSNSTDPVGFLLDNMKIQNNVIEAAAHSSTKKLLFLGSACIYPKEAPEPVRESSLLTGPLEPSNQWYALAKIAGLQLCQAYRQQGGHNFISVMPCNLYGPGDYYNLHNAHVLPALIHKFHVAKETNAPYVTVWGTGNPRREFLYSDDLARACILAMQKYNDSEPMNISPGHDGDIWDLAHLIRNVVGYEGEIQWDPSKPDGTMRRRLDNSKITALGWKPEVELCDGLKLTWQDFCKGARL